MNLFLTAVVDADNPVEGDINLTAGQITLVEDNAAIRQHLTNRLRFFLGEWFLDVRQGIPFFEKILIKGVNPSVVRSIFRRVIRTTPGVSEVERLTLSIAPDREASVSFRALLDDSDEPLVFEDLVIGDL